jgi:hypothetical protein
MQSLCRGCCTTNFSGFRLNLLLFLTALLTSLTGIISGERAAVSRVQATAVAAEQASDLAQAITARATIARALRPTVLLPTPRQTNMALPHPFRLTPAQRLTAEKRRE